MPVKVSTYAGALGVTLLATVGALFAFANPQYTFLIVVVVTVAICLTVICLARYRQPVTRGIDGRIVAVMLNQMTRNQDLLLDQSEANGELMRRAAIDNQITLRHVVADMLDAQEKTTAKVVEGFTTVVATQARSNDSNVAVMADLNARLIDAISPKQLVVMKRAYDQKVRIQYIDNMPHLYLPIGQDGRRFDVVPACDLKWTFEMIRLYEKKMAQLPQPKAMG